MGQAEQVSKLSTVAVSLVYLDHGDIYLGLAHLFKHTMAILCPCKDFSDASRAWMINEVLYLNIVNLI